MSVLVKTVVAGGVIYPAGTAETPELRELIRNPAHWSEDADPVAEPAPAPEQPEVKAYLNWRKADLQQEVDERNMGRDEDALIVVEGNGTVADLAAALTADDTRAEGIGD